MLPGNGTLLAELPQPPPRSELVGLDRLRSEAYLASPVAQIVVTADGLVALTNRQAEVLFGVSAKEVGRPFRDLDVSYRPIELRGHIEQAQVERRMVRVPPGARPSSCSASPAPRDVSGYGPDHSLDVDSSLEVISTFMA